MRNAFWLGLLLIVTLISSFTFYLVLLAIAGSGEAEPEVEAVKVYSIECFADSIKVKISNVGDTWVSIKSAKIVDRASSTVLCYNSNPLLELEPKAQGEVVVAGCAIGPGIYEARITTGTGYEAILVFTPTMCGVHSS